MISKLLALGAVLLASATADVFDSSYSNVSSAAIDEDRIETAVLVDTETTEPADDVLWNAALTKGRMLILATSLNLPEAAKVYQQMETPWDGTLERELALWGYSEPDYPEVEDSDENCVMGKENHGLQDMLKELHADDRDSRDGGDNICHTIQHQDGPTLEKDKNGEVPEDPRDQYYKVEGRRYRVTGADSTIGINPKAGIIFFLTLESPTYAARTLWNVPSVKPDEMPKLQRTSDLTWGLWNRHSKESLSNINYFFTVAVVNPETRKIISRAMGQNAVPKAPGYTFRADNENFIALLGSPNLVAVMFFLLQHKTRFGHNRWVTEIRVFIPNGDLNTVSMLVKVERAPPTEPPEPDEDPDCVEERSLTSATVSPLNIDSWKGGERANSTFEELPPKQEYIANLRSVAPPADEPTCAICRGEWEYPAQEVVEPSPHCSRHPLHKDCLLITFATEDGEEVSNLCPFCRRELFEKITQPPVEPPNSANDTYQQTTQLYDNLVAFHFQIEYNDDKTEDPHLLYPSGPTIEDALQKDGFWSALPCFLDEWYHRNASQIIEQTKSYREPLSIVDMGRAVVTTFFGTGEPPSRRITRLTGEGRAAITALFAHEPDIEELCLEATELLDHQQGEIVVQCIRAALMYYDQSVFPQLVEDLQRKARRLIAYYVLTSLLTARRRPDEDVWYRGTNIPRWLQLVRFRKMLHRGINQWASPTFFASQPPLEMNFPYGHLMGVTEGFGEHDLLEIQYFRPTDVEPYQTRIRPIARGHKMIIKEDTSVFRLDPNLPNGTIFQFLKDGTLTARELSPAFLHDISCNREEGFFDLVHENGSMLRIIRRFMP
ncbi:uncharacterized protein J4E79_000831 [Alternaria viburni]|uniref:uncharacterized protein n=1 Tax=Alternaria viburni TaxID=566460 RepID=UPI0020C31505|nr:uncharacterized protein J4E79_000831 [Alternaria viburni]KAI4670549.1 hypothetical protein J4E79_000831 [Alternaria viburni]